MKQRSDDLAGAATSGDAALDQHARELLSAIAAAEPELRGALSGPVELLLGAAEDVRAWLLQRASGLEWAAAWLVQQDALRPGRLEDLGAALDAWQQAYRRLELLALGEGAKVEPLPRVGVTAEAAGAPVAWQDGPRWPGAEEVFAGAGTFGRVVLVRGVATALATGRGCTRAVVSRGGVAEWRMWREASDALMVAAGAPDGALATALTTLAGPAYWRAEQKQSFLARVVGPAVAMEREARPESGRALAERLGWLLQGGQATAQASEIAMDEAEERTAPELAAAGHARGSTEPAEHGSPDRVGQESAPTETPPRVMEEGAAPRHPAGLARPVRDTKEEGAAPRHPAGLARSVRDLPPQPIGEDGAAPRQPAGLARPVRDLPPQAMGEDEVAHRQPAGLAPPVRDLPPQAMGEDGVAHRHPAGVTRPIRDLPPPMQEEGAAPRVSAEAPSPPAADPAAPPLDDDGAAVDEAMLDTVRQLTAKWSGGSSEQLEELAATLRAVLGHLGAQRRERVIARVALEVQRTASRLGVFGSAEGRRDVVRLMESVHAWMTARGVSAMRVDGAAESVRAEAEDHAADVHFTAGISARVVVPGLSTSDGRILQAPLVRRLGGPVTPYAAEVLAVLRSVARVMAVAQPQPRQAAYTLARHVLESVEAERGAARPATLELHLTTLFKLLHQLRHELSGAEHSRQAAEVLVEVESILEGLVDALENHHDIVPEAVDLGARYRPESVEPVAFAARTTETTESGAVQSIVWPPLVRRSDQSICLVGGVVTVR